MDLFGHHISLVNKVIIFQRREEGKSKTIYDCLPALFINQLLIIIKKRRQGIFPLMRNSDPCFLRQY